MVAVNLLHSIIAQFPTTAWPMSKDCLTILWPTQENSCYDKLVKCLHVFTVVQFCIQLCTQRLVLWHGDEFFWPWAEAAFFNIVNNNENSKPYLGKVFTTTIRLTEYIWCICNKRCKTSLNTISTNSTLSTAWAHNLYIPVLPTAASSSCQTPKLCLSPPLTFYFHN